MTAQFIVGLGDNVLNAYLGDMVQGGGGDFYIEINATYPLKSDINIKMGYQLSYWHPDGGSIFTDGTDEAVLKAGERSFKVRVHVDTGGWFDGYDGDVNWYFEFTHFSDSYYRYLKGSYNGVGYPS